MPVSISIGSEVRIQSVDLHVEGRFRRCRRRMYRVSMLTFNLISLGEILCCRFQWGLYISHDFWRLIDHYIWRGRFLTDPFWDPSFHWTPWPLNPFTADSTSLVVIVCNYSFSSNYSEEEPLSSYGLKSKFFVALTLSHHLTTLAIKYRPYLPPITIWGECHDWRDLSGNKSGAYSCVFIYVEASFFVGGWYL